MAKKKTASKRARKDEAQEIVEDLDLDVDDLVRRTNAHADDEDVVHNRRARRDGDDDEVVAPVLPSDAHRLDGYGDDEHGGYQEEEQLAVATERQMRTRTAEEDFDVAGVAAAAVRPTAAKSEALATAPVIEAVERDFAALSTSERLKILQKESPELLKMLDELKSYLAEVKRLAKPLHELLYERRVAEADRQLVSFLETKVQLMLSYCMHVTFYLLLKTSGQKVATHPVVDNLVEIRVYLEKLWPLEEKLQYSLNRLLSSQAPAPAAQLDQLRPVQSAGGEYVATRSAQSTQAKERRQQLKNLRDAEELEREETAAMTRVRSKTASRLSTLGGATTATTTIAPLSYQEDEDQFFAKLTADKGHDGEDEGQLSLMERLRRRQSSTAVLQLHADETRRQAANGTTVATDSDVDDEADMLSDDDDGDDASDGDDDAGREGGVEAYDALLAEEKQRERARRSTRDVAAAPTAAEVARRKAGKKIELHRGLTKARPRDRKTPRVAQRRKYERGMRVHKAQTRPHQVEPAGGFVGVKTLKPGVIRSLKLQ